MPHLRSTALVLLLLAAAGAVAGAEVKLILPLGRSAYRTDERIDIAVVRSGPGRLAAGDLVLEAAGDDGSRLTFTFPAPAVEPRDGSARATAHLHLDGRLLRPGAYTVRASAGGASASTRVELVSHVRRSTFRLIDWGSRAQGAELTRLGEGGLGFNLVLGDYRLGKGANAEATLRGGADFMQCCAMGGGHQMDLRPECDWSDPLVVRGGAARAVQQAFIDRARGTAALGVHLYDEPGLTWWKDPATGRFTPHGIPAQVAAYRAAFARDPIAWNAVRPDDAGAAAAWREWGRWKESFLEAAWKDVRAGVEDVSPALLPATQSMYAFEAYTDGYYFNVARSLPVISGHGGYDDGPASYFYPSFHFEFGRMRDLEKPIWYLPMWYSGMSPELFRLEQYLSFMGNLQGLAKPPDMTVHVPEKVSSAEGIVESNRLLEALGTIFTVMPATRGEVAVLYSLSQCLQAQVASGMEDNYLGGGHTRAKLLQVYLASKAIHIPFFPVVEEDVVDGTLAAHHRAVVLAGIDFLEAPVVSALEAFAAAGGLVLLTADCKAAVRGAVRLAAAADETPYRRVEELWKTDQKESFRQRAAGRFLRAALPLARALEERLRAAGIRPVLECDDPEVVVSRQAWGEVEYLFAVNAAWDAEADTNLAIRPAQASLGFAADGRPIYDAVRGGPPPEMTAVPGPAAGSSPPPPGTARASFRFGPGEMRVFARTARPIAGVQVGTPVLSRDFTRAASPLEARFTAWVVDSAGKPLSGAVPLEVRLLDPRGAVRYSLYRATGLAGCDLALPLAANDPPGAWKVEVRDLLSGARGTAGFAFTPAPSCGAAAGETRRAVSFGGDREAAFRFFRRHRAVTLVKGSASYLGEAAERLAAILRPWGVRAAVVDAAAVARPRELTADEARTWVGLDFGRAEPGAKNPPARVGFAIDGPAVLLGSPADNPLLGAVESLGFLPYRSGPDFPGRGRGYLAWQRDAVGIGIESVALIAYDAEGMAEAVGTLYEAAAGLDPLTKLALPAASSVVTASPPAPLAAAEVAWRIVLPDRAVSLGREGPLGEMAAITLDGSHVLLDDRGGTFALPPVSPSEVDAARKAKAPVEAPAALKAKLLPDRIVQRVASRDGWSAVAYWGGTLQVFRGEAPVVQELLPQGIAGMAWLGVMLVVALDDGRVLGLKAPR